MLKRILLGLGLLVLMGFLFREPLLRWIKPGLNSYLMTFPPSGYRVAEVDGAWPVMACNNSHVSWGEQARVTQDLDGSWDLAQGTLDDNPPTSFDHQVVVPGFVSEARPRFSQVGVESDEREAFWYRTRFVAPDVPSPTVALCLSKAKYGASVWLNGVSLGMHYGAYTLSEYDLSSAIRFGEPNELLIRVGAEHRSVPEFIPVGADLEKFTFHPGIWDSVSVVYTGPVSIVRTKADPDIDRGLVVTHSTIRNNGDAALEITLSQQLREWRSGDWRPGTVSETLKLAAGETRTVSQRVPVTDATLWSPETPFLYVVQSTVEVDGQSSDDRATRFGMRKVEWKSGTDKGFYLNNRLYPLRGTNIALHRFFEDGDRGLLPWNEDWVRELLSGHMKDFHWNSFRFHLGRAPNFWYDLADEIGLIVTDEYHVFAPIRLGNPGLPSSIDWSLRELEKEFTGWIQENWNHPSIGWWDASNETHNPLLYEVVPLVRHLDETRAWDAGSYHAADQPDDPLEEHPYKLNGSSFLNTNPRDYGLADLDEFTRQPPMALGGIFSTWDGEGAREHAYINNEYGWLWLTRDGSNPTGIAEVAYELLAPGVELSSEQRREIYAYVVSELSGYWRAGGGYAGIQHFLYLGKCTDKDKLDEDAGILNPSATCDNFVDIPNLQMEERWARWAPQAFAPIAINIDRWSEDFYQPGQKAVPVTLINDSYRDEAVAVTLVIADKDGEVLQSSESLPFTLPRMGTLSIAVDVQLPVHKPYVVYAALNGDFSEEPVCSRRKVGFEHPGVLVTLPDSIAEVLGKPQGE